MMWFFSKMELFLSEKAPKGEVLIFEPVCPPPPEHGKGVNLAKIRGTTSRECTHVPRPNYSNPDLTWCSNLIHFLPSQPLTGGLTKFTPPGGHDTVDDRQQYK